MIVRENGSRITTTYDGDDFIIEAARGLPAPIVDQIAEYVGTAAKGFVSHPADVMIAILWIMALDGQFDTYGSGARVHAEKIDHVLGVAWNGQTLEQIRIEIQLYLLWQQTELRGKFLVGFAGRTAGGVYLSNGIYSLGGKIALPNLGLIIWFLSQVGAAVRLAHNVVKYEKRENQVASYIHAFVTGSADGINISRELGAEQVAALRNILRANPNAIKFADPELQFINWLADKFATNYIYEAKRLIRELASQDPRTEDGAWRMPTLQNLIPNELAVPTFHSPEIEFPGLGWEIPWGVPH